MPVGYHHAVYTAFIYRVTVQTKVQSGNKCHAERWTHLMVPGHRCAFDLSRLNRRQSTLNLPQPNTLFNPHTTNKALACGQGPSEQARAVCLTLVPREILYDCSVFYGIYSKL